MNREALEKLADALEFGDTPQAFGSLVDSYSTLNRPENEPKMCALGVACKVYAQEHKTSLTNALALDRGTYGYFPGLIADWYGLNRDQQLFIVSKNDNDRASLPEIGAWIRDNWVKEES